MTLFSKALRRPEIARLSQSQILSSTRLFSIDSDQHEPHETPSRYWHYDLATNQYQRPIFVAATRQHVGKTTTSLAIVSGLMKRFDKVGFIKPGTS